MRNYASNEEDVSINKGKFNIILENCKESFDENVIIILKAINTIDGVAPMWGYLNHEKFNSPNNILIGCSFTNQGKENLFQFFKSISEYIETRQPDLLNLFKYEMQIHDLKQKKWIQGLEEFCTITTFILTIKLMYGDDIAMHKYMLYLKDITSRWKKC